MPSRRPSPRKNGHLDNFGALRSLIDGRCRARPPGLQARECKYKPHSALRVSQSKSLSTRLSAPATPVRSCADCSSSPRSPHTANSRSEEHTSELQSLRHLVCRLLLEKK